MEGGGWGGRGGGIKGVSSISIMRDSRRTGHRGFWESDFGESDTR